MHELGIVVHIVRTLEDVAQGHFTNRQGQWY